MTASSISGEESNNDEVPMQQTLVFSDSLEDLKNLRTQLYSAAEYFEVSYTNDDQKQIVAETLRDYAVKALVNTVDHLGSVTFKVNDFLDEKVDEVSGTEFRVSCVEQRIRTCQECIDHGGVSQQSLLMKIPKYHKRYILPVGELKHGAVRTKLKYQGCSQENEDDWHQFRNAFQTTIRKTPTSSARETPSSLFRKGRSISPPPPLPQGYATFSSATTHKNESGKRTACLYTPTSSGPTTPYPAASRRDISEPRKSTSSHFQVKKENSKETEEYPRKSKRLLNALFPRRKSKRDDMLYTYLDEY